ncbi:MAG TPA: marine proteobacterial sortase target protein [Thermoanaerobaculia bacterium]
MRSIAGGFFLSLLIVSRAGAAAATDSPFAPECGLVLRSEVDGSEVAAPVLGTTIEVRVTGVVARSRVTQIFANPTRQWLTGIYLFSLPDGAAVDALRFVVDGRVIEGTVQEMAEARQTFATAAAEGRKASLLEQLRPDLFTSSVANIGPGEMVEVAIELQQVVRYERGRFVLRFPTLAAPRYEPAGSAASSTSAAPEPALPQPPQAASPINPFGLHVDLAPGFPLAWIDSPTHDIAVESDRRRPRWAIDLAGGLAAADGDFVLEWAAAAGREPGSVFFAEEVDGERYALLMVLPPADAEAAADRLPRETVFVIDSSGSMQGSAMEQAREALLLALGRLGPADRFNVIDFDDTVVPLFPDSVPASPVAVEEARRFVRALVADDGTVMLPALERALQGGEARGLVRQVIFITDGRVANEPAILRFLAERLGERRLFTVAIGAAPNVPFLRRAAELGRGSWTHIPTLDRVAAAMADLFARLEAPLLREIEVAWSDAEAEAWPRRVPDLYLGEPLVVAARLRGPGSVAVAGERGGRSWREELPAAVEVKAAGLDKLWAGRKVQALTDGLLEGADADEVRREVVALGLRHHLVTPYTSLVAVDTEPSAPAAPAATAAPPRLLPLNQPQGSTTGTPVENCITVTAESPLLDARRLSTGTVVSQAELARIPTAADPWSVLAASRGQVALDGVVVTDAAATAAARGQYDFEAFAEVQVATGGADVTLETAEARLQLTRPRGTSDWRGSVAALWSDGGLAAERSDPAANRLDALRAIDGQGGGPLQTDRLWFWAHAGREENERTALGGQPAAESRQRAGLKLNAQLGDAASAELVWQRGENGGAGLGAGPARAPETTLRADGREDVWKGEATVIGSSAFYAGALVAGVDRTRLETPEDAGDLRFDAAGIARGGWFLFDDARRMREARLHASLWLADRANHEITGGIGWRAEDEPRTLVPPGSVVTAGESVGLPAGLELAEGWRGAGRAATETFSLWTQDLLMTGPLTAVFGLRFDGQDLGGAGRVWTPAPRLGLTWTLGAEHHTLVRASAGRFASRLGPQAVWHADPGAPGALFLRLSEAGGGPAIPWSGEGRDPLRPDLDPDVVSRDLRPELTDEAVLGVERTIGWDFVVGLRATWRRTHHLLEERLRVRDAATGDVLLATAADWIPAGRLAGTLPDGGAYDVPFWDLRPGLSWTGGTLLANGDRRRDDRALTLHWEKRRSGRWLSRGNLTWQDGEQTLGRELRLIDDPTNALGGDDDDGRPVTETDTGRPHGTPSFRSARWTFQTSGLVELPRGVYVAATLRGRDGDPLPYYRRVARERGGIARVQLTERPDAFRTGEIVTLDGRLAKEVEIGDALLTLSLEGTNLFDEGPVVARELDLGVTRGGLPDELLEPRTLRVGLRVEVR